MRRLFWVGVGAVGAVVAVRRAEQVARRYTPAGVAERLEAAGDRTTETARTAFERFSASRAERERDLVASLLVTPEEGDASAVFGRRRGTPVPHDTGPAGRHARPAGRVDPDEPLYDF